jgi:hypothetical protein
MDDSRNGFSAFPVDFDGRNELAERSEDGRSECSVDDSLVWIRARRFGATVSSDRSRRFRALAVVRDVVARLSFAHKPRVSWSETWKKLD